MNRLWVRLSLSISVVMIVVVMTPVLAIVIGSPDLVTTIERFEADDEPVTPQGIIRAIPEFVLGVTTFSMVIGVAAGVVISRNLSRRITQLTAATKEVGQGKLGYQVMLDVSSQELADLAAAFNQMSADLRQAEQRRQTLMADVSHELRTPLTVLAGNLRASLDGVYELSQEDVAALCSQIDHLIRLVNDLQLLAQAEARQLRLTIETIDMPQLIQEMVAHFNLLAEEKGIMLQVQDDNPHPVFMAADVVRLRQILTNLLANALQYTPPGGRVIVSLQGGGSGVTLTIKDSGSGIAPHHLPHLFDRFYRTDQSRSRDTGGTGLGLAIVKALTEMHGGQVTAVSRGLNQGTTITLFFPLPSPGKNISENV